MARPEVLDTSTVIHVIREPAAWEGFYSALVSGRTWLTAVTIAELFAGTRSREDALIVERMGASLQGGGRLLTPSALEWVRAGQMLARYVRLHGPLRPGDHLADVLILVTAARIGATVVTLNVRHFDMWGRQAQASGLDVTVTPFLT